mmetsp:Transcript_41058/g.88208  ORF Transcript_41058/g.88208 Transcript_41058/m.88208 type:complete len:213 (+) Transcript_41058:1357-1995(+)
MGTVPHCRQLPLVLLRAQLLERLLCLEALVHSHSMPHQATLNRASCGPRRCPTPLPTQAHILLRCCTSCSGRKPHNCLHRHRPSPPNLCNLLGHVLHHNCNKPPSQASMRQIEMFPRQDPIQNRSRRQLCRGDWSHTFHSPGRTCLPSRGYCFDKLWTPSREGGSTPNLGLRIRDLPHGTTDPTDHGPDCSSAHRNFQTHRSIASCMRNHSR